MEVMSTQHIVLTALSVSNKPDLIVDNSYSYWNGLERPHRQNHHGPGYAHPHFHPLRTPGGQQRKSSTPRNMILHIFISPSLNHLTLPTATPPTACQTEGTSGQK